MPRRTVGWGRGDGIVRTIALPGERSYREHLVGAEMLMDAAQSLGR